MKDYKEITINHSEQIMIVGDFNAYIGNDKDGINGNHDKIGNNGKEYRKFIKR